MQYSIDELKARVPIWKKEVYQNENDNSNGNKMLYRNEIQLVERVCVRKILRFAQSGVLYYIFNKFTKV